MAVITYEQVQTSLGRSLTVTERAQAQMWISDAEVQIRARLGDLALLDQDLLAYVVREAVVSKVKRPDAASSTTVAVDDGSVTKRYDREASTGTVTITEEWWALLTPETEAGAWTINSLGNRWACP